MLKPIDEISGDVVSQAIRIHRDLGPGLLENVYELVLEGALRRAGYKIDRQKPIDIKFDGMTFERAFRIDLLVDNRLVIEVKSVENFNRAHAKQLHTYLRLLNLQVGLLLNFSSATMKEGIHRVVNDYRPEG